MTASTPWIQTIGLERTYTRGASEVRAVDGVDLAIHRGEFVGLLGASGSGKSTILNLLAGLDTPTGGRIEVDGFDLASLSKKELARYRAERVGMVFQSFNLLAHQTAVRNVEIALYWSGISRAARRERAVALLERLGLGDRLDHRPGDLSGGEQQRVAIARALVKDPDVLFADEPTGNLDRDNTREIATLLGELHRDGLTIVLATHDLELARQATGRIVEMQYGRVVSHSSSTDDDALPLDPSGIPSADPATPESNP